MMLDLLGYFALFVAVYVFISTGVRMTLWKRAALVGVLSDLLIQATREHGQDAGHTCQSLYAYTCLPEYGLPDHSEHDIGQALAYMERRGLAVFYREGWAFTGALPRT